jgi:predicted oxidoreductase
MTQEEKRAADVEELRQTAAKMNKIIRRLAVDHGVETMIVVDIYGGDEKVSRVEVRPRLTL